MSTLNNQDPTLLDMVKRTDPDGAIANIVEMLARRNPMLDHAVAKEGNLPTGHRFTTRNTLPAVGWRRFNDGITPSKSTTEQFDETCGMLEGFSQVDCGLARLNGNEAAFRASEDKAFMSALNLEATRALIYASVKADPAQIQGVIPRFDLITAGPTAHQIVSFQAAPYGVANDSVPSSQGDNSSILFVCWGEDTCYLIYPKGQVGGLQSEDLGKQIVDNSGVGTPSGKKYTAWVTHWMWNLGLCVQDSRQVARVCNIDRSATAALTSGPTGSVAPLVDSMLDAYYRIYDPTMGRMNIYVGREIAFALHRAAMSKASAQLSIGEYAGRPITTFLGYPVHVMDSMTGVAEAAVA